MVTRSANEGCHPVKGRLGSLAPTPPPSLGTAHVVVAWAAHTSLRAVQRVGVPLMRVA